MKRLTESRFRKQKRRIIRRRKHKPLKPSRLNKKNIIKIQVGIRHQIKTSCGFIMQLSNFRRLRTNIKCIAATFASLDGPQRKNKDKLNGKKLERPINPQIVFRTQTHSRLHTKL